MNRRGVKSITPLSVLAIVFSCIGIAAGLIIAPLLGFVLGVWLPAKILFVVGSVFGFVGVVFGLLYSRLHQLRTFASLLNSSRRIKVNRIANEMGLTVFKAQVLISRCIAKGLADGYYDRGTGEFFTKEAFLHQVSISDCPHCIAHAAELRMIGETCRCDACGRVIEYTWVAGELPDA